MGKKWILGVALLVVLLGALFLFGVIPAEGSSSSMDITFYDADGNELGVARTGLSIFGIRTAGFEGDVYSVKVAVSYVVTTNMEYLEMRTYCYLEVVTAVNDVQYNDVVHTVAEHQMGSSKLGLENTFEATYLMSELLPESKVDEVGKDYGWLMSFNARVKTTIDLEDGTQRDAEDTCGLVLTLTWVDPVESVFKVESYIALP